MTSSSSILHDDLAAHTARTRSTARHAALRLNDNMAVPRALDRKPRPCCDVQWATTRCQSGGTELARGLRTNRDDISGGPGCVHVARACFVGTGQKRCGCMRPCADAGADDFRQGVGVVKLLRLVASGRQWTLLCQKMSPCRPSMLVPSSYNIMRR